jgi:hypothetical protein
VPAAGAFWFAAAGAVCVVWAEADTLIVPMIVSTTKDLNITSS